MLTTTIVDHAIKVIVNVIYLQLASGEQTQRDVQNLERLRLSDRVGVVVSSRRALSVDRESLPVMVMMIRLPRQRERD